MQKTKVLLLAIPLIILIALVLVFSRRAVDLPEASFQLINQPLPKISIPTIYEEKPLPDSPFLILVWASWCPTCVAEYPYLAEVAKDVPIVGIVLLDNEANVKKLLQHGGNPFVMNYNDVSGHLSQLMGAQGAPTVFFVDESKTIRARLTGSLDRRKWVDKKLKEFTLNL